MLDDYNVIAQRDPYHLLDQIAAAPSWLTRLPAVEHPEFDHRSIEAVLAIGLGSARTAAEIVTQALDATLKVPIIYSDGAHLPAFSGPATLVILSDTDNSDATLQSCYHELRRCNCQIAVLARPGWLYDQATRDEVVTFKLETTETSIAEALQLLAATTRVFEHFQLVTRDYSASFSDIQQWLGEEAAGWHYKTPIHENFAKQIALVAAGKSAIFYGGPHGVLLARYWRQAWQTVAKNLAFTSDYPEFVHNELIGWSSHPVEKPFFTADILSDFDDVEVATMMATSERVLSGRRPQTLNIHTAGDDFLMEAAWSIILANYAATYLAILNNSHPSDRRLLDTYQATFQNALATPNDTV